MYSMNVSGFPNEDIHDDELKGFFDNLAITYHEAKFCPKYGGTLSYYYEISCYKEKLMHEQLCLEKKPGDKKIMKNIENIQKKITKCLNEIDQISIKNQSKNNAKNDVLNLNEGVDVIHLKVLKAFVTLNYRTHPHEVTNYFDKEYKKNRYCFCCSKKNKDFYFRGEYKLSFKKADNP